MELPAVRKVFLSYVQEDGAVAEQIAASLEARGFSTWYYQRDCKTGNYLLATREAIEQCEAFVLFISPRSIVSEDVTIEVVRALKSHKKKFPLLLEISYEKFESDQPEWAQALGASAAAVDSDMLAWEVQSAYSAARKQNGQPHLIPVRVNFDGPMPDTLADILNPIQYVFWKGVQDNAKVVDGNEQDMLKEIHGIPTLLDAKAAGTPRPGGPGRRFAHHLGGHQPGDKLFDADTVEINGCALVFGFLEDAQPVLFMADVLPFGKNVHDFLLTDRSKHLVEETSFEEDGPPSGSVPRLPASAKKQMAASLPLQPC